MRLNCGVPSFATTLRCMDTGQTVTHAIVCKQRLLLHGKGCLCLTLSNDVVRVHILLLLMWLVSHSQSDLGDAGQNLRKHTLLNTGAEHQHSKYGISSCLRSSEAHVSVL